ncbi:MAG: YdbH domain-containing protein [Methylomonas sp.]|nr:YdbH domain-containing protein [Methylomonas sp.]
MTADKIGSKGRLLAAALLIMLIAGIGAYRYRGMLMQSALERALQGTPLSVSELNGVQFGWYGAQVANMQFELHTDFGVLSAHLQGVRAGYDLEAVTIADARMRFSYRPAYGGNRDDDGAAQMAVLPVKRLTIAALEMAVDTDFGTSAFSGRAEAGQIPDGDWVLALQSPLETLRLLLDLNARSAALLLAQGDDRRIAQLNYRWGDSAQHKLEIDAEAQAMLDWLGTSALLPDHVRAGLPASIQARLRPLLTATRLNVSAVSDDGFESLKGRVLATRSGHYLSSAEVEAHIPKKRLDVDGHLDMTASELLEALRPWLPDQVTAWQTSAGQAMGRFRFSGWPQTKISTEIYLRAYHVAGVIGPVRAEDGYLRFDLASIAPFDGALEIDIPTLQLGQKTRVHNLQLKARLDDSLVSLERASLPLFGGFVEIVPTRLDLAQSPLALTLVVDRFDLAKLLDSLDYPGLSGTGTLSGKLPLRLAADSIEVREGILDGMHPGVLRYRGPIVDPENVALKALRDLRYHSLQGKLNYQPDGAYRLGLRLEGKNPDVFSGHAVAFNLNLTGQLPELLQKGIMAGDFDRPILEQVKSAGKP